MAFIGSSRKKLPPVDIEHGFSLGLKPQEWDSILDALGREPNEIECAVFARLWSESYSYRSAAAMLSTIAREGSQVIDMPNGIRAGVVDIGDDEVVVVRFDHSNLQGNRSPYYGVQSSAGSVIAELVGIGASPVAIVNLLRFGNAESIENQVAFQNAVEGIGVFGNTFGAPIVGGDLYFHKRYDTNFIFNTCAIGVVAKDKIFRGTTTTVGSSVLYIGADTGSDGLVLKSSEATEIYDEENTPIEKRAIKFCVSDPFFQRRLFEACRECMDTGLLSELIAVGVGGLGASILECARKIDEGIRFDVDLVPLRVDDMPPADVLLSESCERVVAVCEKAKHREVSELFHKHGLSVTRVGEVLDSDDVEFSVNRHIVANIPFRFAMESIGVDKTLELSKFPPMLRKQSYRDATDAALKGKKKKRTQKNDEWAVVRNAPMLKRDAESEGVVDIPENLEDVWVDLLASSNLCSRRLVSGQFDQSLGTDTVIKAGGDAAVIRLRASDGRATLKGVAVCVDSNSLYGAEDVYLATVLSVAENMRNLAATGARPVAIAHCLNFGDPSTHKDAADLAEAIRALRDASDAWGVPVVSDGVDMFNGSSAHPILPIASVVMIGIIDDVGKACSSGFKDKENSIFLLGKTKDELGCSEYLFAHHHRTVGSPPDIDFESEKQVCELVCELIEQGLLQSAHDVASGGFAVAFAESCLLRSKAIGACISLDRTIPDEDFRPDAMMFSESSGRFIISFKKENEERIRELCSESDIAITGEGTVGGKLIQLEGAVDLAVPVATAERLWSNGLNHLLGISSEESY